MKKHYIILIIISLALFSCNHKQNPKPMVYFRMSFPEHQYQTYSTDTCPFMFDFSTITTIRRAEDIEYHPCWFDIRYPQYKGNIHLTLRQVNNNLDSLLDDSHTLVYKHTVKADAIETQDFINDSLKVYATVFFIEGNAASPLQFHITDSVNYFVRGSVYFDVPPNSDSLAPAIDFLKEDALHFIESFEWKKIKTNACF